MKLVNSCVYFKVLSALVVIYQKFTPPLVEKMKLELCMQDWDQAEDTANRILAVEPKNIEAMRFKILQLVCRKGSYEEGGAMLRRLYAELEKLEPKNAYQFVTNAQLFSRICGKDVNVLEATAMFAEKAASIDSTNSASMAEVGHQVVKSIQKLGPWVRAQGSIHRHCNQNCSHF